MPRSETVRVTWEAVDRVRREHEDWSYEEIAASLRTGTSYVRATFYRRQWPLRYKQGQSVVKVAIPVAKAEALRVGDESPMQAVRRVVDQAVRQKQLPQVDRPIAVSGITKAQLIGRR